jgi:hypothetical protein
VGFEITDGDFGGVASVATVGHELKCKLVLIANVVLHVGRDFIVDDMLDRSDTSAEETKDEGIVSSYHFGVFATSHRFK